MKKSLLVSVLVLTSLIAGAQVNDVISTKQVPGTGVNKNNQTNHFANTAFDQNVRLPRHAADGFYGAKDTSGYLYFNTSLNKIRVYVGGGEWQTLGADTAVPTFQSVTTAGNTSSNAIVLNGIGGIAGNEPGVIIGAQSGQGVIINNNADGSTGSQITLQNGAISFSSHNALAANIELNKLTLPNGGIESHGEVSVINGLPEGVTTDSLVSHNATTGNLELLPPINTSTLVKYTDTAAMLHNLVHINGSEIIKGFKEFDRIVRTYSKVDTANASIQIYSSPGTTFNLDKNLIYLNVVDNSNRNGIYNIKGRMRGGAFNRDIFLPDTSGNILVGTQTIRQGAKQTSPSEDAVFNAINTLNTNVLHTTGNETKTSGSTTFTSSTGSLIINSPAVPGPGGKPFSAMRIQDNISDALDINPTGIRFTLAGHGSMLLQPNSANIGNNIVTMPDTTGTIALTSDLSAYQPLENQRLSTTDAPTFSDIETTGSVHLNNGIIGNNAGYLSVIGHAGIDFYTNDGPSRPLILDGNNATVTGTLTAPSGIFTDGTQGLVIRPFTGGSGYGAIYPVGVTPSNTNFSLVAVPSDVALNSSTQSELSINGVSIIMAKSTGATIAGTTATTNLYTTSATPTVILVSGNEAVFGTGATITVHGTNKNGYIELHTGTGITTYGATFNFTMNGFSYPNLCTPTLQIYAPDTVGILGVRMGVDTLTASGFRSYNISGVAFSDNTIYRWTYDTGGY